MTPGALQILERELVDQGKLVEAGWIGLVQVAYAGATTDQLEELRTCFFAGAAHLLSSMKVILDAEPEPTETDLRRMDRLDDELKAFIAEFELRRLPAKGSA
jgi:hypothetical protein